MHSPLTLSSSITDSLPRGRRQSSVSAFLLRVAPASGSRPRGAQPRSAATAARWRRRARRRRRWPACAAGARPCARAAPPAPARPAAPPSAGTPERRTAAENVIDTQLVSAGAELAGERPAAPQRTQQRRTGKTLVAHNGPARRQHLPAPCCAERASATVRLFRACSRAGPRRPPALPVRRPAPPARAPGGARTSSAAASARCRRPGAAHGSPAAAASASSVQCRRVSSSCAALRRRTCAARARGAWVAAVAAPEAALGIHRRREWARSRMAGPLACCTACRRALAVTAGPAK